MSDRDAKPANVPHDPLSVPCRICNAKPFERCGSIIDSSKYLEVPHFTRLQKVGAS